ncbi:MAG: hypothetical protein KF769_09110 [Parvibaculum sp.]|nr:hypothetical protein [Parvibaculum sp.]
MFKARPYLVAAILATMDQNGARQLFRAEDFDFCDAGKREVYVDPIHLATTYELNDAIEHLVAQGFIEKIEDPYTQPDFAITNAGRQHFFDRKQDRYSAEARFMQRGVSWLGEALKNIHEEERDDTASEDSFQPDAFQSNAFQTESNRQDSSIPASDRYVSVADNQPLFDSLSSSLTEIKDQYSRDHNRLAAEPACVDLLSEVDATIAQIQRGRVRLGQLTQGLLPTFDQACLALAAYPGLVLAIQHAMAATQTILRSFGLM